jgi:hypothetical protein
MNQEKTFKEAVDATISIGQCFQVGLRGLGTHSKKIKLGDTSKCEGSVDIDSCLAKIHPQSSRWDYCFSYKGEVFFVEVHGAITSEVSTVLKKLQWLKSWLNNNAPEINKLKAKSRNPFYWIQSSNFTIPPTSKQFRTVTQAGIKPIPLLELI